MVVVLLLCSEGRCRRRGCGSAEASGGEVFLCLRCDCSAQVLEVLVDCETFIFLQASLGFQAVASYCKWQAKATPATGSLASSKHRRCDCSKSCEVTI